MPPVKYIQTNEHVFMQNDESVAARFLQDFTNNPGIFDEIDQFSNYTCSEADVDACWERQQLGRIQLAVMPEKELIGEVI